MDAIVKHGAQCNSDHMMFKVKLQTGRKTFKRSSTGNLLKKFDVSKLQGSCG